LALGRYSWERPDTDQGSALVFLQGNHSNRFTCEMEGTSGAHGTPDPGLARIPLPASDFFGTLRVDGRSVLGSPERSWNHVGDD